MKQQNRKLNYSFYSTPLVMYLFTYTKLQIWLTQISLWILPELILLNFVSFLHHVI